MWSVSGSSSTNPTTRMPYSGRAASFSTTRRAMRPVPTTSVGSVGISQRRTTMRAIARIAVASTTSVDEEDGELADRRLLDAERGVGELTRPGRRRGQQHESRDIVGRAVRHAQLVLRVVAVEPRERDPREQPAEHERRVATASARRCGARRRRSRRSGTRWRPRARGCGAGTSRAAAAGRAGVRGRRVIVEARIVVRDGLVGDQGGNVRTCLERRCRHASPSLPSPNTRGCVFRGKLHQSTAGGAGSVGQYGAWARELDRSGR